ncbi:hypothetical protein NP603_11460 [Methylomonas sp. SURF-1]|uniref:Cellobiose phosphorylase n=1 Tax=Methylomonas aurea TaxID=2952224 RepID=A0ABT1UIT0_9GAMM|nr:hypothetical protein [Methylomonas sp. SURF-1]MCQ8181728.1 hypothetical protein [Methylomonas sp. SURF-1]
MAQPRYYFADDERFVVEQYNDCAAFASFLPGIAGVSGRPAWAFYVNRGQAIASFGVRNKDGAFLEFFPADKAYQLTPSRGFRTFLKVSDGQTSRHYEPFQRGAGADVVQRLSVTPHEVGVEEINPGLGFSVRADMFTLPEANVAGLVRRVEIGNISSRTLRIEIVDGLPQVLPYAMNQWILKFMSRTSEAFMRVEGVDDALPFYRLKVWPTDSPQVEPVDGGNFFFGCSAGRRNPVIVDPERVFGLAGDFSSAERFFSDAPLDLENQVAANQTPAAFQTLTLELPPGTSQVFYAVYGHAESVAEYQRFVAQAAYRDEYFAAKREANRALIDRIGRKAFTATALPLFDGHVRQCYLDNGLRGGFPTAVPGSKLLYLFGRKHGDLERDYNDFLLQDTPYSEGNGDFRDVLQNRRVDLFFEPGLGGQNIRYFFNLIQPDGYNPCALRNWRFAVAAPQDFAAYFAEIPGLEALLETEFKYAELWQLLAGHDAADEMIGAILAAAREVADAEFDRGYWSDHWTYLVDLLVNYRAIFPDRLPALLLEADYTFFDPTHYVAPRAQKYRLTGDGLRQYGAVQFSAEKKSLIESRSGRRYQVRAEQGRGAIVHTTLLGKIVTLVANKLATLDPAGIGIEMEADRPGWCDALNGLPGILGSAVNETIELKRLVDFSLPLFAAINAAEIALPAELAAFVAGLDRLLDMPELTPHAFWHQSGALKEAYRRDVFIGFTGAETALSPDRLRGFFGKASAYLAAAVAKAESDAGITTYYAFRAGDYHEQADGSVEITRFLPVALPPFLEGFVHALRIADRESARRLYLAARNSELYDRKLGMYRLNAALGDQALDLGRIGVFNYGWLENGSIFLHMHYKFVLEMLRAGLVAEFYADIERLLVAFRDAEEYKRNPLENSSFLVSSGFSVDPRQHGRGCVARLSGSTVELLQLWTYLFFGDAPFRVVDGELRFQPEPVLAARLFSDCERSAAPFAGEETLPVASAACALFGATLVVYLNPQRRDCFGPHPVKPQRYRLYFRDGSEAKLDGAYLDAEAAAALRQGMLRRLDIELA